MAPTPRRPAPGPLTASPANPRYFTVAGTDGPAVYLTGSHIWNNLHDGLGPGRSCVDPPERNDFPAYLDFLTAHAHNFIRLWRWENFRSQAAGGGFHLCMTPQPWPRTGPGHAVDGKPKFDLTRADEAFYSRLRERVAAAGAAGIYVAVMLFEGWGLHLSEGADRVEGHPFHAANNVNDIGIASIVDYQVLPLDPRVQALQEAYLRKVVDTVHDLPNVLYEVANESSGDPTDDEVGDSTGWQYQVIEFVRRYEHEMGYDRHPIGMTMQYPVPDQSKVNDPLFTGPADWVSPGFDDAIPPGQPPSPPPPDTRWHVDPPANDGTKVVIADTDHFAPGGGDALWAWKSFVRGHHPILMDFGIIDVVHPLDPALGVPPYEAFEPARYAMGDTRRYAERMGLVDMVPRGDLSSTGYALANPGVEYLVLALGGGPFRVMLAAGTYAVEWYDVTSRETVTAEPVTVEDGPVDFTPPAAPAVLYLRS